MKLNNLSGKAWTKLSKSVWIQHRRQQTVSLASESWERLIEIFSQTGGQVLELLPWHDHVFEASQQIGRIYCKVPMLADFSIADIARFDFSAGDYRSHLASWSNKFKANHADLKPGAYIAVIIADQRYKNRYYCCHADMITVLENAGYDLQGLINIIDDNRCLKAYGYPTTYVPNIINRFAIIARKPR